MGKFQIDESVIENIADSDLIYKRGVRYFNQGRVFDLDFNPASFELSALVEGSMTYHVRIGLDESGKVLRASCECPHSQELDYACKHIVAVLKEAQRIFSVRGNFKTKETSNPYLLKMLYSLSTASDFSTASQPVKIEPVLYFDNDPFYKTFSLELKVGNIRTYVVKDMKHFIKSVKSKQELVFGKGFTYNPLVHSFKNNERKLMELLDEMVENDEVIVSSLYSVESGSFFKSKRVYLPIPYLKRILGILGDLRFTFHFFDTIIENPEVIYSDFKPRFSLNKKSDKISFSSMDNDVYLLTQDGEIILSDNKIYITTPEFYRFYMPVYEAFAHSHNDSMDIAMKDLPRFFSEAFPIIETFGEVNVDDSLKESIIKEPLTTKIFLDKDGDGITARVEYHYGNLVINPFSPILEESHENLMIVRDFSSERKVQLILESFSFKVEKDRITLSQDEEIYDFIYEAIPSLSRFTEVFYSDSFKNMKITSSPSFNGSVRLLNGSMLEMEIGFEGIDRDELLSILDSYREKKKFYRLKNGAFLPLDNLQLTTFTKIVDGLALSKEDLMNDTIKLPMYRAVYLDSLIRETSPFAFERNLAFKEMVQNIKEPKDMEYTVPQSLKKTLRDYQKTGFKWLKTLSSYGLGGILADDMGLGKTLQVLAFILSEKEKTKKPNLVVAPTSLVFNWRDEAEKFTPELKVVVVSGNISERMSLLNQAEGADIIVTSYALLRRDIEQYYELDFDYCFIDEAQHIKNPGTLNAKSVKQINAHCYFALTGTPVENALTELWSIFDFIMPGYLLSQGEFSDNFVVPVIKYEDKEVLEDLSLLIKPFVLRRMKKEVLKELPEKIETKMSAPLTSEQEKLYMAYLEKAKLQVKAEISANGFSRSQIKILAILTRLRQLCCHPSLFIDNYDGASGKMDLLLELLEDSIDSGHRCLIFSQFTGMLKLIADELEKKGIEFFYLDGNTKAMDRIDLVNSFNKGAASVFLISLKAGGTGLNLTGADTVIHYDPWWNPAVEDQASDRAYRIGQENIVHVIKLISEGTIEEKIFRLQQKKRDLIDALVQPGETFISKLTEDELKAIFDI
jgi:SNF2 family DNA or RNA helicase